MANQSLKGEKLKRALRDNLKKRKAQSRKIGEGEGFSIKLRSREVVKKTSWDENPSEDDKE